MGVIEGPTVSAMSLGTGNTEESDGSAKRKESMKV